MKWNARVCCLVVLLAGMAGVQAAVQAPAADDIALERVYVTVPFDSPLAITTAPGDDTHLYVMLQDGRIQVLPRNPSATSAVDFLDIRDRVNQDGGEKGLLGLAFDPDYASNGRFYVNYVTPDPLRTIVSRFRREPGTQVADPDSELKLLQYAQPYPNHNGGWVGIGPDRHLYIASGDGGSAGDPQNNAQRLDTLLGKVLRIARNGAIPEDNPFVDTAGARGEIWAYGLRNPFRMGFDAVTGKLWAGDVGQGNWEEIDLIRRGGNYGWRVYEGNHNYNNPQQLPPTQFIAPLHEYSHADGCSVTGGLVYRGAAIPALQGYYIYSDYCSGTLWALRESGGVLVSNNEIGQVVGGPAGFGEDQDGELYITTVNGRIYRIVPGDGSTQGSFPPLLSQTGLFADTAALQPAADLVEYGVRAPFWSDRALKRRWLRLPAGGQIGFKPVAAWSLPVGSATIKHFEIVLASGATRRLETRVFKRDAGGWHGASYRWNPGGTDASLVTATQTETIQVRGPGGQPISQLWEYPSQSGCLRCHTQAAGHVLGLVTAQMNRNYGTPAHNQLARFAELGLFSQAITTPSSYRRLAYPMDKSFPLAARARAYLHTNCAQCHRPGGPTGVDMDLRWNTAMAYTRTRLVAPSGDDLGVSGAMRIVPGDPSKSLLWLRMRRLDGYRMPPLGTHVVHTSGVQLVRDWIEAGAP